MNIIGNKFSVDFGMAKAVLHFQSNTMLTFTITEKDGKEWNETETVELGLTELRPQLYLATWKEKNGNTITQVQDFEKGIVYSNWTLPTGEFIHVNGTIEDVKHYANQIRKTKTS